MGTVIFDKTGTLTKGDLHLDKLPPVSTNALALAAGLASHSTHPLSRALCSVLADRGIEAEVMDDVSEMPGFGLRGTHAGREVRIGSRDWVGLKKSGDHEQAELCLSVAGSAAKVFTFEDELRDDAVQTIAALKKLGLRTVILSGDREAAVDRIAKLTGVDSFHAGWKPQEKAAYIASLENAGERGIDGW